MDPDSVWWLVLSLVALAVVVVLAVVGVRVVDQ